MLAVVLFGATGKAGSKILKELLCRGHKVTAVVRDRTKLAQQPGLDLLLELASFDWEGQLITDKKGESRISLADYAIALIDEFEQGKHRRERFTIGY